MFDLADSLEEGEAGDVNSTIEKINRKLSESLNFHQWWFQDRDFRINVSAREYDLVFSIRDKTGTDYTLKERSNGLKYFLSYYIQYLAHEASSGNSEILLMDELDAHLSSQAQQDLLRIFEALSSDKEGKPSTQVVYATHSPFLINKNHAERIRVLGKGIGEEGTRVIKDAAKNHYEPLRSAFGAFVGETTFIGNCNLMVEGITDQILIAGAVAHLRSLKKISELDTLDLNHLTIVPAGSASHIPYLVYLARGRDTEQPAVIVLLDSEEAGNTAKKDLTRGGKYKSYLKEDFIFQIGNLSNDPNLKVHKDVVLTEIEDLIPLPIAIEATRLYLQEFCGISEKDTLLVTADKVDGNLKATKRVYKAIEAYCKSLSDKGYNIDKAGFAKSVIKIITNLANQDSPQKYCSTNDLQEFENNFKLLFRRLSKMVRQAEQEYKEERVSQKINRLKHLFIRDYPESPQRERAYMLLEQIETVLDDGIESDYAKEVIKDLRREHELDFESDLSEPIKDYEKFKIGLEQIKYAGQIATQQ